MTAKTPEEAKERMVEAARLAACTDGGGGRCICPEIRQAVDAALSAADSAGWPQSLIDKARAQAIEECATVVAGLLSSEEYSTPQNYALREAWEAIRALSAAPKATP